MERRRRQFLKTGGLLGLLLWAGLLGPEDVLAEEWNRAAFEGKQPDDVIRVLGGIGARESAEVAILAPEIAENGAVVPLEVISKLDKTQSIAIVVEKNPNPLAANFSIPDGTLPDIQTRVKMAQTCNVYALVKANGKFYFAVKEIKITQGGCGG
jgi:sulfur-oxidizing protein SoxY